MRRQLRNIGLILAWLALARCHNASRSQQPRAEFDRHSHHAHDDGGDHDLHGSGVGMSGGDVNTEHMALHPGSTRGEVCRCDVARAQHGWCDHCRIGYVALVPIRSALLFETLDPHGHVIGHDSIRCAECSAAIAADAWCNACEMGWFDGKAYFTRLTHALAMGRTIAPEQLTCQACRHHVDSPGWCDACRLGIAGNVAFDDRATFQRACTQLAVLQVALDRVGQCEMCACAIVVDGTCPLCHVAYRDGRPVPLQEAPLQE